MLLKSSFVFIVCFIFCLNFLQFPMTHAQIYISESHQFSLGAGSYFFLFILVIHPSHSLFHKTGIQVIVDL